MRLGCDDGIACLAGAGPNFVRGRAVVELARIGDHRSLGLAIEIASDASAVMRSFAAQSLGILQDEAGVRTLLVLLEDETEYSEMWATWRVMDDAAKALRGWKDQLPEYQRWVDARLSELETGCRRAAATSLGFILHPSAVPVLLEVGAEDGMFCFDLLQEYESRESTTVMCEALRSADNGVRISIAQALGKKGDPAAFEALGRLMASGSSKVRCAAARGMRWLDPRTAARQLQPYEQDSDPDVRKEIQLCFTKAQSADPAR
jgi:HEAT repeat protein